MHKVGEQCVNNEGNCYTLRRRQWRQQSVWKYCRLWSWTGHKREQKLWNTNAKKIFCVYLRTYDLRFKNLLISTLALLHCIRVKMKTKTLMWMWVNVLCLGITYIASSSLPQWKCTTVPLYILYFLSRVTKTTDPKTQSVHVSTAAGQSNVRAGCSPGENLISTFRVLQLCDRYQF